MVVLIAKRKRERKERMKMYGLGFQIIGNKSNKRSRPNSTRQAIVGRSQPTGNCKDTEDF